MKPSRSDKGKSTDLLGFIHRFVPSGVQPAPVTLLLLHGTGGDENDLLQLGRNLSPRAALLSPRGQVLENGAPRFFRRTAIGVFDIKDLIFRTHELSRFVEAASLAYTFDLDRVVAVGYSNGANIASSLLLLHPRLLAGAILLRPVVPFTPEKLPDLSGVRVLILGGLADQMFPKDQTELLFNLLKEAHAETSVHWQNSDHSLTEDEVVFARRWLSRFPEFAKK